MEKEPSVPDSADPPLPGVHGAETYFSGQGGVLFMTTTDTEAETGWRNRSRTPGGRSGIRMDLVEGIRKILLRDTDSGLDWICSFYY